MNLMKVIPGSSIGITTLTLELNVRKKKVAYLLLIQFKKSLYSKHLKVIEKHLELYYSRFENCILLSNLNPEITERPMDEFCLIYKFKNLVKNPT